MENSRNTILVGFWCTLSMLYAMTTAPFARAETIIPLDTQITQDTVWSLSESPYIVTGRTVVHAGVNLTIEPGVVVKFQNAINSGIDVHGSISALGTESEPIIFTSIRESYPTISEYNGIGVLAGGVGDFDYVDIRNAQFAIYGTRADISIKNSSFTDGVHGVAVVESTLEFTGNTLARMDRPVVIDTVTASQMSNSNNSITQSRFDPNGIRINPAITDPHQLELRKDVPYVFGGGMSFDSGFRRLLVQEGVEIQMTFSAHAPGSVDRTLNFSGGQEFTTQGTQGNPVKFSGTLRASSTSKLLLKHTDISNFSDAIIGLSDEAKLDAEHVRIFGGATIGISAMTKSIASFTDSDIAGVNTGVQVSEDSKVSMLAGSITNTQHAVNLIGGAEIDLHSVAVRDNGKGIVSKDILSKGNNTVRVFQSDISNNGIGFQMENVISNVFQNIIANNDVGAEAPIDGPVVNMENNWWGDASGPQNPVTNPEGTGNLAEEKIDFDPWLGEQPFSAPDDDGDGNDGDDDTDGDDGGTGEDEDTGEDNTDDEETLPSLTPILLIPGNMGSELIKNYGDMAEVWLNLTRLILSPTDAFLDELKLLPNGIEDPTKPMRVGGVLRSVNPPIGEDVSIYSGLIQTFTDAGYIEGESLFVFPYDWRMSVSTIAPLLSAKIYEIQSETGALKVHLVGHSMGGLVAKQYIADFGGESVASLAFIGTPHLGSVKATKMLLYGDSMGLGIGKIKVLNSARAKSISQNMPGVYDLLPSKRYSELAQSAIFSQYDPAVAHDTILGFDYEKTKQFMSSAGSNTQLIPRSEIVHDEIDSFSDDSLPVYNFVGCTEGGQDSATISGIQLKKRMSLSVDGKKRITNDYQVLYTSGDGIVTSLSAGSVPSQVVYMVKDASHTSLPSAIGLGSVLLSHYRQEPPTLSGSVSAMTTQCSIAGRAISIHGPVNVSVVDAGGNRTEVDASGSVSEDIAGVSYTQIEGVTFVYIPNTFSGEVQITPTGPLESFDVYARTVSADSHVESQALFSQIPIHESSFYSLTIAPENEISELIEETDDSQVLTHAITARVGGVESVDITSPLTSATVENGNVTLLAEDVLSGVLRTEYSENQEDWNIYTEPFSAYGKRIWFMSTDKAGNLEEVQYVDIPEQEEVVEDSEEDEEGEDVEDETDEETVSGGGGGTSSYGGGTSGGGYGGTMDAGEEITSETKQIETEITEIVEEEINQPVIARYAVPRPLTFSEASSTTTEDVPSMEREVFVEDIVPKISAQANEAWISEATKVVLGVLSLLLIMIIIMLVRSIRKQEEQYLQT